MVLLDNFANKSNTFKMISPSLALPFPPISSLGLHFLQSWIAQLKVPCLGRLRVRDHRTPKTVTTLRAPYRVKDVTTRKSSAHLPGRTTTTRTTTTTTSSTTTRIISAHLPGRMSSPSRARHTALRPTRAIWDKSYFEFIEEMFNLNKLIVF